MMSKILVWRSKTGTYYYDASTPEALEESARKIIQSLVADGMVWNPGKLLVTWDADVVDATDEEIDALPGEKLQELARTRRGKAQRQRAREIDFYNEEKLMWDCIQGVLNDSPLTAQLVVDGRVTQTPITAWRILQQRNGWEYEHYSIANVLVHDTEEE